MPGISFHEIPSDPELRAKWLKVISRDDWTPNTTSCYSTVCSRHFGSSDFKEGCKIRKLKKDTVPSIFEEYPAYLQPPKNRERSDGRSVRKREAAAPVYTPPPKRRAVESQLESPSLPLNDYSVRRRRLSRVITDGLLRNRTAATSGKRRKRALHHYDRAGG
ncbi:hypothetical protein HPB49_004801 [Dermacentor silvarum]|uniref:Uncharacterized protein n=1 Tax=Dermacentor silvarum TaxID=543639 RepID=A0ACB8DI89_DERSI|nr:hypothetical protein HPB49_004801 [Dermacentor silvarum]